MIPKKTYEQIANILSQSHALILLAGAGMSVDSGIPAYRGENGLWGQVMGEREGNIFEIMNPAYLSQNPVYMWQRFGRRVRFFEEILPHAGHDIILKWIRKYHLDYFCVTSNIDGQLQKAGFLPENIMEIHGNIHFLQCSEPCSNDIWDLEMNVDFTNPALEYRHLPKCPKCEALARPNCLIFRDKQFVKTKLEKQQKSWNTFWNENQDKKIIIFEIGAGTHIPSIRAFTKKFINHKNSTIIRINIDEAQIESPHFSLQDRALKAIWQIDEYCKIHAINYKNYKV